MAEHPFKVIQGTPAPDTPKERMRARVRANTPPELVRCPRCTSGALIQVRLGMHRTHKGAKPSGGAKQWVCALCLAQGEVITVDF